MKTAADARAALFALTVMLAACGHDGTMQAPAGPQAERIHDLWDVFLAVSVVVWVSVTIATVYAVMPRPAEAPDDDPDPTRRDPATERKTARNVGIATAATVFVLLGLVTSSALTGRRLSRLARENALNVDVIGHQWWWEFRYRDPSPARITYAAEEMHVPVGRTVRAFLHAEDVIHSFWVPALHGKRDAIPGYDAHVLLRADRPGRFPGRCAEFCGLQHAMMAFEVVAETPAEFDAWLAAQRSSAREPMTDAERRGQRVFLSRPCILCHSIRGTVAMGAHAPDLTHVASRRTLAGGALPNRRADLARWIRDPQSLKPGTRMPATALAPGDLDDLLTYLESLR